MTCQDFASRAQTPYTVVPEMLPSLHQHPALPHHSYFLQNNSVTILSTPPSKQSDLKHGPSPAYYFGQDCFHQQQLQYLYQNSQKNSSLLCVQYHTPSLSIPLIHASNKIISSVQVLRLPIYTPTSTLNVRLQESDGFSHSFSDHQKFPPPQFPQNLSIHPPSPDFFSLCLGNQPDFHNRSVCSTLPSHTDSSIAHYCNTLCTTPPSSSPHTIRVCTKENESSPHPSKTSQSHVRVTSHQFNHRNHQLSHHYHRISSQPQGSNSTCLSFSRKMVKPSQLDLARQRLSSVELPDVTTPEPPQLDVSSGNFAIHFK